MKQSVHASLIVALSSVMPFAASAATTSYTGNLIPLNNSGISGTVNFTVDTSVNTLTANVNARGLSPNTLHPQHIHGSFAQAGCTQSAPSSSPIAGACLDGDTAAESVVPSIEEDDIDGDGFLETVEGAPAYGPIILNLADPNQPRGALPGSFPMSDAEGNVDFTATYDLSATDLLFDSLNEIEHEPGDLFPLDSRVYVIHGVTVTNTDPAVPGDMFEVQGPTGPMGDGISEFVTLLPGAATELRLVQEQPAPIPLPAAAWSLIAGLGGIGALRLRRRK